MSESPPTPRKRFLDPIDRILEVLFGLIMVLTFTGSLSAAEFRQLCELVQRLIGSAEQAKSLQEYLLKSQDKEPPRTEKPSRSKVA